MTIGRSFRFPEEQRTQRDKARKLAWLSIALLTSGAIMGLELVDDETVLVETSDVQRFRRSVATTARDVDAALWEVVPLDDDLDSVFRYLVGRP